MKSLCRHNSHHNNFGYEKYFPHQPLSSEWVSSANSLRRAASPSGLGRCLSCLTWRTTRTGELSDGKSGASFRTWQNCASLPLKWRVMNDRLPFYRLGGFIARNILKDQITNTTILQTYAESPRNKTHRANFQYDLLLGLPHQSPLTRWNCHWRQLEIHTGLIWGTFWENHGL